jgi:hypothetical protein
MIVTLLFPCNVNGLTIAILVVAHSHTTILKFLNPTLLFFTINKSTTTIVEHISKNYIAPFNMAK